MITWCTYCQRYLGEKPPLTDFSISHGICPDCLKVAAFSAPRLDWTRDVQEFFLEVSSKAMHGRSLDFSAIVASQQSLGINVNDLLMGIIQPILYEIGDRFAQNRLKVATEHKFTMFCEELLHNLRGGEDHNILYSNTDQCENLLVCVDSNYHSLGIQFVSFFLRKSATKIVTIFPGLPGGEVVDLIRLYKPVRLGISVAMANQQPWLQELAQLLKGLPLEERPEKNIVGGYLFRTGKVDLDPIYQIAPFEVRGLQQLFSSDVD